MDTTKTGQRGIALFMTLVILLLLSAITVALVFMATTDSLVKRQLPRPAGSLLCSEGWH